MGFGERLHAIRVRNDLNRKPMEQKAFAKRVGVSPAMVWRIETGRDLPSDDMAGRMFEVLKLDPTLRAELSELLKQERIEQNRRREVEKQSGRRKARSAFGTALRRILKQLDITATELGREIGRPSSSALAWAAHLLPDDKILNDEIIPYLQSAKVKEEQINKLKQIHLETSLRRSLDLAYLSEREQSELLEVVRSHYAGDKKKARAK
jgi:transcriptional regulator with XRE-family HTH domain